MDFDYAKKLSSSDKQWLAAFAEEYYKGFYQKKETQVTPLDVRRAACAARKRVREHKEPLAFKELRSPIPVHSVVTQPKERAGSAAKNEAEVTAAWRQRSTVHGQDEDEVIRGIDRGRRGRG